MFRALSILVLFFSITFIVTPASMALAADDTPFVSEPVSNGQGNGTCVLSSWSVTSGRSPLSSGFGATIGFDIGDDNALTLAGDDGQGYLIYDWIINDQLTISATAGILDNTLWGGPIVSYEPADWLSFMYWVGPMSGHLDTPEIDPQFGFSYAHVGLTFGEFGVGYSLLHFLKNKPNHNPELSWSPSLDKAYNLRFGVTYDSLEDEPLWMVGIEWSRPDSD